MMDHAITATLGVEGKWSDHPADPGGKTLYGVTEGTYRTAVRRDVIPANPKGVAGITVAQARKIYEVMYWKPIRGDEIPAGLNALVFDIQVNSGQGGRRLQNALNALSLATLRTDNAIGDKTLIALNQAVVDDPRRLWAIMAEVASQRAWHWQSLATWPTFRRGWTRRGQRILIHATRMACGDLK